MPFSPSLRRIAYFLELQYLLRPNGKEWKCRSKDFQGRGGEVNNRAMTLKNRSPHPARSEHSSLSLPFDSLEIFGLALEFKINT
jgi:hypothetical protein